MPTEPITAAAQALHEIGALIMVGSLFFLLFIVRPITRDALEVGERQVFFVIIYRYLFRWQWLALLFLWISGGWNAHLVGITTPSITVQIMAAGGAAATLLTLFAQTTCYFHLEEPVEDENWARAGRISSHVRKIMALNLFVCLILLLAGAIGPHL